jgi:mannobiose 2-epimerase
MTKPPALPSFQPALDLDELRRWRDELNQVLRDNILAFWLAKCIDRHYGGYHLLIDSEGRPKRGSVRGLVGQARMVWLFARASRQDYGGGSLQPAGVLLAAARHGYEFLRDRLWDPEQGGFFWSVDAKRPREKDPRKDTYGQAFGLFALSEYVRASNDEEALRFAGELAELLERHAHDAEYGGYVGLLNRDWRPDAGKPQLKLMNTHLHLMEALTAYVEVSGSPLTAERLAELVHIQAMRTVRQPYGVSTDRHERDWTPVFDEHTAVSFGHDVENATLLMDALRVLGRESSEFIAVYRSIWEYILEFGFDAEAGGLYHTGLLGQPASDREKVWWVQAEALLGALRMFVLTRDARFLDVFRNTWRFVCAEMVDWRSGEWRPSVPGSSLPADKAQPWKEGYHNGRAMIECLKLLAPLAGSADAARDGRPDRQELN